MQKHDFLDVMNLFRDWDDARFQQFILKRISEKDFSGLMKARYGLQGGMSRVSNKSICPEEYVNKFLRWQKYLENGIKHLWRRTYPNPLDNPGNKNNAALDMDSCLKHKRDRDEKLAQLLRKHSY